MLRECKKASRNRDQYIHIDIFIYIYIPDAGVVLLYQPEEAHGKPRRPPRAPRPPNPRLASGTTDTSAHEEERMTLRNFT